MLLKAAAELQTVVGELEKLASANKLQRLWAAGTWGVILRENCDVRPWGMAQKLAMDLSLKQELRMSFSVRDGMGRLNDMRQRAKRLHGMREALDESGMVLRDVEHRYCMHKEEQFELSKRERELQEQHFTAVREMSRLRQTFRTEENRMRAIQLERAERERQAAIRRREPDTGDPFRVQPHGPAARDGRDPRRDMVNERRDRQMGASRSMTPPARVECVGSTWDRLIRMTRRTRRP